jgi:N-acetylglucosaminyl-diphospho-decaprenol L-rhamnosyltransferase
LREAIESVAKSDGSRPTAVTQSGHEVSPSGIDSPTYHRAASVLVVIVNYRTADLAVACLGSLASDPSPPAQFQVVVVENHSGQEETLSRAIADRGWANWVRLDVADRNGGFAFGNNRAIRQALASTDPPTYVLLLNADTEARPGAVRALVEFMDKNPEAGLAGSSFECPNGSDWPIAFRFITPLSELERGLRFGPASRLLQRYVVAQVMAQDRPQPVDWVAGASLIIRREVFETIGLMDEGFFLY